MYVDAARFLPDNVKLSRVTVMAFSALGVTIKPYGGEADAAGTTGGSSWFRGRSADTHTDWEPCGVASSMQMPTYKLRVEFREERFDPTLMILVVLACVNERGDYHHVGVSAVNAFYDFGSTNRFQSPADSNDTDVCLNEGAFQLPVHHMWPEGDAKFDVEEYRALPAIPCTTLLVRIEKAQRAPGGYGVLSVKSPGLKPEEREALRTPAPAYGQPAYDSTLCRPTPIEQKIYSALKDFRRGFLRVREVVQRLRMRYRFQDEGDGAAGDEDSYADAAESGAMLRARKEKEAVMKASANKSTEIFVLKSMVKPAGLLHSAFPPVNPFRMRRYIDEIGFFISIDGLDNMPNKNLPFVIYSLSPPASFYSLDKNLVFTEDVELTNKWELTSFLSRPRFGNGLHHYRDVDYDEFMVAVLEVRLVDTRRSQKSSEVDSEADIDAKAFSEFGWTFVPIFARGSNRETQFINAGAFRLPIFEGRVDRAVLDVLAKTRAYRGSAFAAMVVDDKRKATQRMQDGLPTLRVHPNYATANVRLVDAQQPDFAPSSDVGDIDSVDVYSTRYTDALSEAKIRTEKFVPKKGTGMFAKPIQSLIGKSVDPAAWRKNVFKTLVVATGIDHYNV